jgi:hypothetical protein
VLESVREQLGLGGEVEPIRVIFVADAGELAELLSKDTLTYAEATRLLDHI